MTFRRVAIRATIFWLALWCIWQFSRSDFNLVIPVASLSDLAGIQQASDPEIPIHPDDESPVEPDRDAPAPPVENQVGDDDDHVGLSQPDAASESPSQHDDHAAAKPRSRIAKVTVAANTLKSSMIGQALQTHKVQNDMHGYTHFIATTELVGDLSENDRQKRPRGAWSKPAYLLSLIVAELAKPESERLEWLFWFDADTIVMNPHTPLEIFLPPAGERQVANVSLLMASNWDGLNSGVFALRVEPWTVSLLSAVLAYPIYLASKLKTDRFRDQSAFQWLLTGKDSPLVSSGVGTNGKNNLDRWVEVPMRWFNSLPINNAFSKTSDWIFSHKMTNATFDNGTNVVYNDGKGPKVHPWKVMQGDMVVHFAGANPVRESWMGPWLQRAEAYSPEWSNATRQADLIIEASEFWGKAAEKMMYYQREQEKRDKAAALKLQNQQQQKTTTTTKAAAAAATSKPAAAAAAEAKASTVPPPAAPELRQARNESSGTNGSTPGR